MIGAPLFAKAEIRLPNNKSLTIIANHVSRRNCYIQSMKYNGMAYSKNYITHDMIMHGGTIVYEMGDKPNKEWGTKPVDCQPNL
ncbi:MAG: glycoside hydrolase domain-containing protein [Bacteroidaceae bacterium]